MLTTRELGDRLKEIEDNLRPCPECRGSKRMRGPDGQVSCLGCEGTGVEQHLLSWENLLTDDKPWWLGNDTPLMRRLVAERGESLPEGELGHQRQHGPRIPPEVFADDALRGIE